MEEFRRLRKQGIAEQVAVSVFTVFLLDADRKDAAELILLTYGYPAQKIAKRKSDLAFQSCSNSVI